MADLTFPFLFGVLAFLSPCIIPMLQVYLSMITGSTISELSAQSVGLDTRRRVLMKTACFILGFTVVFVTAGMFAGTIGLFLKEQSVVLNYIGGILIVVFGLKLLGVIKFTWLSRLHLDPARYRFLNATKGYPGAFIVGLFFAVACSHCFGPLLYSTLIVAAKTQSSMQGFLTLLAFSVGLAVPYFIVAMAVPAVLGLLRRFRHGTTILLKLSGAFLIVFGLLIFFNQFQILASVFSSVLPWGDPLVR